MRPTVSAALALALALVAAGCAAANPFRFEDQLALYHDDLRWGRLPAAETAVSPRAREAFVRRHRRWGTTVQIIDLEVENARSSPLQRAVRTRFVWMRGVEATTRETVVESTWRPGMDGAWVLDEERVVAGDPGLLAER